MKRSILNAMSSVADVAVQLKAALDEAARVHTALEDAKAKLAPLEAQCKEADNKVNVLMGQYAGLTTDGSVGSSRRKVGSRAPQKKREPIVNIDIQMRKAYTTAVKGGATDKDAKKAAHEAGKKAAEKAGYAGSLPTPTYSK